MLVTGASTGIGAATVARLAAAGHLVFAGVRDPDDGDRIRKQSSGRVEPVILDVTDPAAVERAVATVTDLAGETPLLGVVNNAGVAFGGPLELQPLDEWRAHLDVNVVGAVAVTKAFLPLLRRAQGRLVFVGSVSGRIASPLLSAYCASKFALEGLAASLSAELSSLGVKVSIVEPGPVSTPIWDKTLARADEMERDAPAEIADLYRGRMASMKALVRQNADKQLTPERVAEVIERALVDPKPRPRYPLGFSARAGAVAVRVLPDRALVTLMDKGAEWALKAASARG
jgi:NAD(P)-dependent dehydrogenase (short-subunit alcohol dehydrogenase family)